MTTTPDNIRTLSIRHLFDAIKLSVVTGDPLVILGPPGIGKTQIAKQAARDLNYSYTELLLAGRDIGDIMLPYVAKGDSPNAHLRIHYSPKIPHVDNPLFDGPTLLNIDEVTGAKPMMQNVLLKVLDEWIIGETLLRDDVRIIATGNRSWDHAHVEKIGAPLANRANIIHFDPDVEFWLQWGLKNNIHPIVLAWVRFDPTNLFQFDPKQFMSGDYAFPAPRSNERISNLCHTKDKDGISAELFRAEACGAIGQVKGLKFTGFLRIQDQMPDLFDVMDGKTTKIPDDPSVIHTCLYALIQRADREHFENILGWVGNLPNEWHMMFTNALVNTKPNLIATSAWSDWMLKHPDAIS